MDYDPDKVDQAVLALLYLTLHDSNEFGGRAWKGHDWAALDSLHEKGLIGDPKSKAKSVVLDAEGIKAAEEAFCKLFGERRSLSRDIGCHAHACVGMSGDLAHVRCNPCPRERGAWHPDVRHATRRMAGLPSRPTN